jgi:hypothetical protein
LPLEDHKLVITSPCCYCLLCTTLHIRTGKAAGRMLRDWTTETYYQECASSTVRAVEETLPTSIVTYIEQSPFTMSIFLTLFQLLAFYSVFTCLVERLI